MALRRGAAAAAAATTTASGSTLSRAGPIRVRLSLVGAAGRGRRAWLSTSSPRSENDDDKAVKKAPPSASRSPGPVPETEEELDRRTRETNELHRLVLRFARARSWRPWRWDLDDELFQQHTRNENIFGSGPADGATVSPIPSASLESLRGVIGWGFLRQEQVAELVEPAHLASQHTRVGTRVYPQAANVPSLLDYTGGSAELCRGALEAYLAVVARFNARETSWERLDMTTPPLSDLLSRSCFLFLATRLTPRLSVDRASVQVKLLGIWLEEGSADKPGKALGRFDLDDIKFHLISGLVGGLGPEASRPVFEALGHSGKQPMRICAAFQLDSIEAFNIESARDRTNAPPQLAKHFWVFESDFAQLGKGDEAQPGSELVWRLRNINDAIIADEGEKV
jgi:hypothetical protein